MKRFSFTWHPCNSGLLWDYVTRSTEKSEQKLSAGQDEQKYNSIVKTPVSSPAFLSLFHWSRDSTSYLTIRHGARDKHEFTQCSIEDKAK